MFGGNPAATHVLFQQHFAHATTLRFETRSGVLAVSRRDDGLVLDFPARPDTPAALSDALREMLGVTPVTGSARCTFIPCWAERLGIGGRVIEYLRGEITLEDAHA